jgi:hypothetical protein
MQMSHSIVGSTQWIMDREQYGQAEAYRRMEAAWARHWGLIGEPVPEPPQRRSAIGTVGRKVIGAAAGVLGLIGLRRPAMTAGASDA